MFLWCPPTPLGRELQTDSIIFAAASKRDGEKINKALLGVSGGVGRKQLCSFGRFITNLFPACIFITGTFDRQLSDAGMWVEQCPTCVYS